jgi:uncharacterized membrane protein
MTAAPGAAPAAAGERPGDVSHLAVLRTVARRGVPSLIEATVVPALLFYVALLVFGTWVAFVVALAWSYGAIGRRFLLAQAVPPILLLATAALTVRTLAAFMSGSTFVYFIQPVLGTVAMAFVFLGSIALGRPLIASLAGDFWPLPPEVASHPAVVRLFRSLTILWAGVYLATAVTTFVLLQTMPVSGFVPAKMLSGYLITFTGIMVTIVWSVTTARREGLVLAATALH